jgi:hypothetical protein
MVASRYVYICVIELCYTAELCQSFCIQKKVLKKGPEDNEIERLVNQHTLHYYSTLHYTADLIIITTSSLLHYYHYIISLSLQHRHYIIIIMIIITSLYHHHHYHHNHYHHHYHYIITSIVQAGNPLREETHSSL